MSLNQDLLITLPSNVKNEATFEYNTIANYKTKLFMRIQIPKNEVWKVGLTEIQFTTTWFNVRNKVPILFYDIAGKIIDYGKLDTINKAILDEKHQLIDNESGSNFDEIKDLYVKPGYYDNVEDLVNELNSKLYKLRPFTERHPRLIFDKINHRVTLSAGSYELPSNTNGNNLYFPDFGEEVNSILGLLSDEKESLRVTLIKQNLEVNNTENLSDQIEFMANSVMISKEFVGFRAAELNADCRSLFVYCDIVQPSFVGDSFTQLIRAVEVPFGAKFNQQVTHIYNEPHYFPLITNVFDTIEIDIKDDTGHQIPFEHGRVIVTLKIKKYE